MTDRRHLIDNALTGGRGQSEGIHHTPIGHRQRICTPTPSNNVNTAGIESSILDRGGFAGGPNDVRHSMNDAHKVDDMLRGAHQLPKHIGLDREEGSGRG
jgi:hypothetical protein